jgi:thioredoxin 1
MKKVIIFLITVAFIIAAGIGLARLLSDYEKPSSSNNTTRLQTSVNGNSQNNTSQGSYISLTDYESDPSKYADTKKVYFFHASWCPICQSIHKEIEADRSKIPAGVTFIKTDFDSATDLRQKYGVTTQYTFVQVDESDNEVGQWSATSLDAALAKVKL